MNTRIRPPKPCVKGIIPKSGAVIPFAQGRVWSARGASYRRRNGEPLGSPFAHVFSCPASRVAV